jgi:hypothetical protein
MIRGPMMHVLVKHTVSIPVLNRWVPGTAQATESSHIVTGHRDFRVEWARSNPYVSSGAGERPSQEGVSGRGEKKDG